MDPVSPPTQVRLDELVRTTANYSMWLKGAAATSNQVGIHGFRFDAHEQRSGVTLDTFHILFCVAGRASIQRAMAGALEQLELGPGDVLVNPMGIPLRWSWTGAVEVLNIAVHPSYLNEILRESLGGHARIGPRARMYTPDAALSYMARDLHDEITEPDLLGAQRGAHALGERIAIHLLRNHVDITREAGERTFRADERQAILAYVESRVDQPLRIKQLAARVGLGEHHFTRTFRATFGLAPQAWLRELRLARARELLETTSASISDIAMATGFADQSHLTRCFGARFGKTPAVFRTQKRPQ